MPALNPFRTTSVGYRRRGRTSRREAFLAGGTHTFGVSWEKGRWVSWRSIDPSGTQACAGSYLRGAPMPCAPTLRREREHHPLTVCCDIAELSEEREHDSLSQLERHRITELTLDVGARRRCHKVIRK